MSNIEVFSSEYVTVQYVPDKQMIYHVIHKPVAEAIDVFHAALEAGSEALKEHRATKWLSDDRNNGPLPQEHFDWLEATQWSHRTIQHGWKYWANVVPEELMAAGSLAPVIEEFYKNGLHLLLFTSIDEAQEWLDKQS